ncbi:MAG: hypothetical protein K2Y40_15650 [Reyranella sp.]|nr:hypothetical protein [Reyranella sp.]
MYRILASRLESLRQRIAPFCRDLMAGRFEGWRWPLFAVCALFLAGSALSYSLNVSNHLHAGATSADWGVTDHWIASAECARKTGAWLVVCPGGRLVPLANQALADDPGHALLLEVWAMVADRSLKVGDAASLNVVLNVFGMLSIATLLFAARLHVASLIVLVYGGGVYLDWTGVSPHPGLVGAASFAAVLPCTLILSELGYLSRPTRISGLFAGAILLGLAALLREPIGMMGLIVSLAAIVWVALSRRELRRWLRLVPLLLLAVVSWQTPRWVLLARDMVFSVPKTAQIETHGISHNLYLGLGAIENKFGLSWTDATGAKAVADIDPTVAYVSRDYFRVLWRAYLQRVAEDPLEVLRIYATKTGIILGYSFPDKTTPLWLVVLGGALLLVGGWRWGVWRRAGCPQAPAVLFVALSFLARFVLQGAVAHHSRPYAHPIGAFVLMIMAVGGELLVRLVINWVRARPGPKRFA